MTLTSQTVAKKSNWRGVNEEWKESNVKIIKTETPLKELEETAQKIGVRTYKRGQDGNS